jgi:sulfite exporter TauE/SafE
MLTESELISHPKVSTAKSHLGSRTIEISGEFDNMSPEEIAQELTTVLKPHGYTIELHAEKKEKNWNEFKIAIPVALGFLVLFYLLQKLGIVNLIDGGNVNYGTAFIIGAVASLSTCMAVVGGLVLSMSATFAKEGDKLRPQALFHFGRLTSFFVLGGVIGVLGSAFALSSTMTIVLSVVIGLVMLVMGINLLDMFPWAKRLQLGMPKFLSKHAMSVTKINHTITPFFVGIATFFLPCGFTQSMQVYTLSTGGFMKGGLTMLAFALGTLPVLALLSFSSYSIQESRQSGVFFKTAGLVVIIFALYNLMNALVIMGIVPPLLNI